MRRFVLSVFAALACAAPSPAATPDQVWAYLYGGGAADAERYVSSRYFHALSSGGPGGTIVWWSDAMPLPAPEESDLLPDADCAAAREAARRGEAIVVGGVPRPMTPAEISAAAAAADGARQAAKPAKLKAAENAVVSFWRAEGAVAADAVSASADQLDAMFAAWDALPDAQSEKKLTKYDRLLKAVERRGGSEGDVRYHP